VNSILCGTTLIVDVTSTSARTTTTLIKIKIPIGLLSCV